MTEKKVSVAKTKSAQQKAKPAKAKTEVIQQKAKPTKQKTELVQQKAKPAKAKTEVVQQKVKPTKQKNKLTQQKNKLSATVTDITTDEIKAKFAAGSIPLQNDFSNLIDIAECGRRAVGQSKDQTDNTVGVGLALAADSDAANKGKLSVLANNGITVDASGVKVKPGNGITVDGSGVSVNQSVIFPRGMIMMFSGTTVPSGWYICNGQTVTAPDGTSIPTPNLIGKFILAGSQSGETSGTTVSGASGSQGFTVGTSNQATGITINGHALTTSEMPAHSHNISYNYMGEILSFTTTDYSLVQSVDYTDIPIVFSSESRTDNIIYESVGGGAIHGHDITDNKHAHTSNVIVPYYVLVYIMKV